MFFLSVFMELAHKHNQPQYQPNISANYLGYFQKRMESTREVGYCFCNHQYFECHLVLQKQCQIQQYQA